MRYKSFPATYKALDKAQGIVECYASVYGVLDSYKERMAFGCYAKSLGIRMPKSYYQHDRYSLIGSVIEAEEIPAGDARLPDEIKENGGLYSKIRLNMRTQKGSETFALIDAGDITEFSVGYRDAVTEALPDGTTLVKEVELFDISPVDMGACPKTQTISAKASGLAFEDHLLEALGAVRAVVTRSKQIAEKRTSEGGKFSIARLSTLKELHSELGDFIQANDQQDAEIVDETLILAMADAALATSQ